MKFSPIQLFMLGFVIFLGVYMALMTNERVEEARDKKIAEWEALIAAQNNGGGNGGT